MSKPTKKQTQPAPPPPANPFEWRTAGMDRLPLNAGIKPTPKPANTGGRPPSGKAFGIANGTIPHMAAQRAARILATRPTINQVKIAPRKEQYRTRTYDGNFVSVEVKS